MQPNGRNVAPWERPAASQRPRSGCRHLLRPWYRSGNGGLRLPGKRFRGSIRSGKDDFGFRPEVLEGVLQQGGGLKH